MRKLKIVCTAKWCGLWETEGWSLVMCKDCPNCVVTCEDEEDDEEVKHGNQNLGRTKKGVRKSEETG